jgi:hypothetical protein
LDDKVLIGLGRSDGCHKDAACQNVVRVFPHLFSFAKVAAVGRLSFSFNLLLTHAFSIN